MTYDEAAEGMTKVVRVSLTMESTHDLKGLVLLSYDADADEWSVGFKRVGDPKMGYSWIADRLRSFCTELELQGMVEGEEPDHEEVDDDSDSGNG